MGGEDDGQREAEVPPETYASRRRTTGSPGCAPPRRCSNSAPDGVQPLLAQWAQGGNHDKSGRAAASELDSEEPPARPPWANWSAKADRASGCIASPLRGESVNARGPQAPAGRRRRRRSSAAGGAAVPRGPAPRPRGRARGGARRLPGPDVAQRVRRGGAATGGGRLGDTNHTERPRGVSCTAAGRVSASGKGEEPPQGRRAAELVLTAGRTRLIGAVGGTGSNGREGGPHAGDGHSDGRAEPHPAVALDHMLHEMAARTTEPASRPALSRHEIAQGPVGEHRRCRLQATRCGCRGARPSGTVATTQCGRAAAAAALAHVVAARDAAVAAATGGPAGGEGAEVAEELPELDELKREGLRSGGGAPAGRGAPDGAAEPRELRRNPRAAGCVACDRQPQTGRGERPHRPKATSVGAAPPPRQRQASSKPAAAPSEKVQVEAKNTSYVNETP